jgi:hypothetical protein
MTLFKHKGHDGHEAKPRKSRLFFPPFVYSPAPTHRGRCGVLRVKGFSRQKPESRKKKKTAFAVFYADLIGCFSPSNKIWVALATSSTALSKASSLTRDGLRYPLTFRTNCNAAARISSSVTGISVLRNVFILRHMFSPIR